MQPVGLKLLISPPLPRREADVHSRAPGASRDGGMVGQRHGKYSGTRRPTREENYSAAAFIRSPHKP